MRGQKEMVHPQHPVTWLPGAAPGEPWLGSRTWPLVPGCSSQPPTGWHQSERYRNGSQTCTENCQGQGHYEGLTHSKNVTPYGNEQVTPNHRLSYTRRAPCSPHPHACHSYDTRRPGGLVSISTPRKQQPRQMLL